MRILDSVKRGMHAAQILQRHEYRHSPQEKQQQSTRDQTELEPEPRLLIIDAVAGIARLDRPAMYGSLVMWMGSKGRERTRAEWEALAARAGWPVRRVWKVRGCVACLWDLRPSW